MNEGITASVRLVVAASACAQYLDPIQSARSCRLAPLSRQYRESADVDGSRSARCSDRLDAWAQESRRAGWRTMSSNRFRPHRSRALDVRRMASVSKSDPHRHSLPERVATCRRGEQVLAVADTLKAFPNASRRRSHRQRPITAASLELGSVGGRALVSCTGDAAGMTGAAAGAS